MQGPKISSVLSTMSIGPQLPHNMSLKKEVDLGDGTKVQFLVDIGSPVTLIPQSALAPDTQLRAENKKLCRYGRSELHVLGVADVSGCHLVRSVPLCM